MSDLYSPAEIARAAGVPADLVVSAVGDPSALLSFEEAVSLGRRLARGVHPSQAAPRQLFSDALATGKGKRSRGVPLFLSSTLHLTMLASAIFVATITLSPTATALRPDERPQPMRLVYLVSPGPGGGGGGGGLVQPAPPPKAMLAARAPVRKISSPLPVRVPPKRLVPAPHPVVVEKAPMPAPVKAEVLPAIVAPLVPVAADPRTRIGVLADSASPGESHGPGRGGGVGTGTGTGIGEGDGAGIGPGSGGGIGGGPYRPGSGVEAPRILREVKADYTEDARQRGIEGEVVVEIVVKRDGSVSSPRVLQGLGYGLSDRAVQAVRQWRFAPALRLGSPVDVIVEVSVEFKLR